MALLPFNGMVYYEAEAHVMFRFFQMRSSGLMPMKRGPVERLMVGKRLIGGLYLSLGVELDKD